MSDKNKTVSKPKKINSPSTSKTRLPIAGINARRRVTMFDPPGTDKVISKPKTSKPDATPDSDVVYHQVAYGKFLRAMLEDCLVDEKIEREETQIDIQISQLADRFQSTMNQLDKTSKRLKDINFVVEQKRLLDLKSNDCSQMCEMTENSNVDALLSNLTAAQRVSLDELKTKNVDFGYNKESGHKQLLDATTDAIEGLENIKKHSNLDMDKFKEYERTQTLLEELDTDRTDLESLKSEFKARFPRLGEKLLRDVSDKIARFIENDVEDDDD